MKTPLRDHLKNWARLLKRDVHALYLAARDPRVPWYAKWLAFFIAAYALSPIDLIPDFIPVLRYLDDFILVPLGLWMVIKMIPKEIMDDLRATAAAAEGRPVSMAAAAAITMIWAASIVLAGWCLYKYMTG